MTRRHLVWAITLGASLGLVALTTISGRAAAGEPVDSMAIVEARAFLDEYQTSSEAASPLFYDLYSDRAMIHARIEGHEQGVVFRGRAYKEWGRDLAASHRAAPDASEFRDATVEERGGRLVIRAKRFSVTRCFWDLHYAVGLEREGASYRIVDEHLTMNPAGVCSTGSSTEIPVASPVIRDARAQASRVTMAIPPRPSWRPLTSEEIARSAERLARESSARHSGDVAHGPPEVSVPLLSTAPPVAVGPTETLWVTPRD